MKDSKEYLAKKAFFENILTIYGRHATLEALEDGTLKIHKLHLSKSNKDAEILDKMIGLANERDIEIAYHDGKTLSRISKNAKQDQGVALDIMLSNYHDINTFISQYDAYRIIVLDGVTNPQNFGMIVRSCAAGNIHAILIPSKGSAQISPLVIKASAGTLFKIPIIKVDNMKSALVSLKNADTDLYSLSSHASNNYNQVHYKKRCAFVLGNESSGVSDEILSLCDLSIKIPMNRGVESLNVAVTASLLAFME